MKALQLKGQGIVKSSSKGITLELLEQAADDSLADAMLLANLIDPERRHLDSGNFLNRFYQSSQSRRQAILRKAPSKIVENHFKGTYTTIWYSALAEQLAHDFLLRTPAWLNYYHEKLPYENFGGGDNKEHNEHLPASMKNKNDAMRAFARRNIFITENELTRKGCYPRLRESCLDNPVEMSTYRGKSLDGDYRKEWRPRYLDYLAAQNLLVYDQDGNNQQVMATIVESMPIGTTDNESKNPGIYNGGSRINADVSLEREVGRHIAQARKQKQLTQKELADRCGLRQSNVSRLESGGNNTTLNTLQLVAQCLDKELRVIFV